MTRIGGHETFLYEFYRGKNARDSKALAEFAVFLGFAAKVGDAWSKDPNYGRECFSCGGIVPAGCRAYHYRRACVSDGSD